MSTEQRRVLAQRVLIGAASVVAIVCFSLATPGTAPGYALASNLILRVERAALPVALFLGLGGLAIRLWAGDKVSDLTTPGGGGMSMEAATKPTKELKEVMDADIRDLSARVTTIEKALEAGRFTRPAERQEE